MRHVVGTFYNGAERRQVQKQHDRFRHRTQKAQHPAYLCHHSIIRYRAKRMAITIVTASMQTPNTFFI